MNVTIVEGDLFDQDVGVIVKSSMRGIAILSRGGCFCLKAFLLPSRNMVANLPSVKSLNTVQFLLAMLY